MCECLYSPRTIARILLTTCAALFIPYATTVSLCFYTYSPPRRRRRSPRLDQSAVFMRRQSSCTMHSSCFARLKNQPYTRPHRSRFNAPPPLPVCENLTSDFKRFKKIFSHAPRDPQPRGAVACAGVCARIRPRATRRRASRASCASRIRRRTRTHRRTHAPWRRTRSTRSRRDSP